MPSSEAASNADFDNLMQGSGLQTYSGHGRTLPLQEPYIDDIDKMTDEIGYELDYEAIDPEIARAYHAFVERSWREYGYKPRRVAALRSRALQQMGFDGGTT